MANLDPAVGFELRRSKETKDMVLSIGLVKYRGALTGNLRLKALDSSN